MKFLLVGINAKFIHSNPAIRYLKEYAGEKLREEVETVEYTINNRKEEILADIFKRRPDVIGISCYIWNFALVQELLPDLLKVLPERDIWLGGPEVSFEGQKVLAAYPMITGIMVGEGEETFRELLTLYRQKEKDGKKKRLCPEDLKQVRALLLREGFTGNREELPLDDLPFLYGDLQGYDHRILYYETSRGCPFGCTYCLSSVDRKVRIRSLDLVLKELRYFLEQKVPQVKFVDRTFNCNREHALAIWNFIRENDNGVTNFHFEVAADIMTEEQLAALAGMRPGLVQLEIGVQTVNERTLDAIDRHTDTGHALQMISKLKETGNIHIHLDLIAGLPFEDYESFKNSFNRVYRIGPEQLQLGFLKVLKGSPLFYEASKYGIVYQEQPPYEVLYTNWLSYEEVCRLKRIEEMVELYYNSGQFRTTLQVLQDAFASPFALYESLARYYEEKGYFREAPARSYRYQVLVNFLKDRRIPDEELYRELLSYDFYLRENAKSRPAFAADLKPYYARIQSFYVKEEEQAEYLLGYQGFHARQLMKMTHMEVFHYPVWEAEPARRRGRLENEAFVLFDYRRRNPLTGDAKSRVISV